MISQHVPVLLNEVLEALRPNSGDSFVDGTINGGGHAAAVLEHRLSRRRGRPAEAVFASVESEDSGARGPNRQTG